MFENKKILVLGFARSGYEVAKFLAKRKNKVIVNDLKEEQDENHIKELKKLGVEIVLGSHPDELLNENVDYLIKNPGVPIDHQYVLKARKLNIPVINEVEVAFLLMPKIHLIAITGTNGKTTTTTLVYEMLKKKYQDKVFLTGNIGYPLISFLDKIKDGDYVVMETSCQQLENLEAFKPEVAILTNIEEAHIDFMKTYEHYKEVKKKIFKNMSEKDIAIINKDNEEADNLTKDIKATKLYFSKILEETAYIKNDNLYYKGEKLIDVDEIKLRGFHNYENIMGALIVAKHYNVDNQDIIDILKNFNGVEHRLEYVATKGQVDYYNDSKATNIKSSQIALNTFSRPTIIILGGMERNQNFEELRPFMKHVKAIIAIADCRERIKEIFGKEFKVYTYEFLKEGFEEIKRIAEPNDIVLLSPASASWGQYEKFEDRGDEFKKLVNSLKEN